MAEAGGDDAPPQPQGDIGWRHGFLIDAGRKRVQCQHCGKQMNGGVFRLKQHIAGMGKDVSKCNSCPQALVDEMRSYMTGREVQRGIRIQHQEDLYEEISGRQTTGQRKDKGLMRERPISLQDSDDSDDEDDSVSPSDDQLREGLRRSRRSARDEEHMRRSMSMTEGGTRAPSSSSGTTRGVGRSTSLKRGSSILGCGGSSQLRDVIDHSRGPMDMFLHRKQSVKQPSIKQAMKGVKATAAAAKHAVKNIVKWFLHAGVPAHTASSPYFQTMLDSIGEAGPGLKAPSPRDIYGKYLDEEVKELKDWVDSFKTVWMARGCTLMCDGWTGTTRKSMINFLVYCSEGTIFMKSVDASGQIKNADYLFGLMDDMVEQIGEENIVQVVTDNEASYKAAGKKLMEKRKHLYWVPCAAHSLDLMMEDIGNDKHVAELVSKAQRITTFIYGHNRILHMMRECTDGHDILRPGPTRFASNFLALESLHKFRHELGTLIHCSEYLTHVDTLRAESRDVACEIADLISDSRFWDKISYYLKLVEPIVQVLRMVDGEDKNDMGYLYEAMDKAKEKLKEKHPTAFRKWWRIIDNRWESTLHHDLHAAGKCITYMNFLVFTLLKYTYGHLCKCICNIMYAGYFFNIQHQYGDSTQNDGEVLSGTINVITRLSRSTDDRIDAMMEVQILSYYFICH
jgi:Protein of unknown function (DUF 659)